MRPRLLLGLEVVTLDGVTTVGARTTELWITFADPGRIACFDVRADGSNVLRDLAEAEMVRA
jgi:hypothetical protein